MIHYIVHSTCCSGNVSNTTVSVGEGLIWLLPNVSQVWSSFVIFKWNLIGYGNFATEFFPALHQDQGLPPSLSIQNKIMYVRNFDNSHFSFFVFLTISHKGCWCGPVFKDLVKRLS